MALVPMRDMVVLLPGIMGSVLEQDGRELWAPSRQAAWRAVASFGGSLERLALHDDDPDADVLADGVRATRLMPDVHLVPGLKKIDGYSAIARMIRSRFDVVDERSAGRGPANYFELPYDWLRDNAVAARALAALVEAKLAAWRERAGADAKVILLAHSMGGLVSRHYLEVLGGWEHCRALVTFGTPYGGSPDALEYLANGYKKLCLDLTDLVRSLTSIYQLLPTYALVEEDGECRPLSRCGAIDHVDPKRVDAAAAFHERIEAAVNAHLDDPGYLRRGYKTIPVVGVREGTLQSARLAGGVLTSSRDLPGGVDPLLADGDGTVPRRSAIPAELSNEFRETFIAERHGSIQNHPEVLEGLFERLKQMQVRGPVRGPEISVEAGERPAIALDLDAVYLRDEPVVLSARVVQPRADAEPLEAEITPVDTSGSPVVRALGDGTRCQELRLDGMAPGLYRVEVRSRQWGPLAPPPVHDLFEVMP
jgi:pimeloyl-ACP methyl ester carboxylesterase